MPIETHGGGPHPSDIKQSSGKSPGDAPSPEVDHRLNAVEGWLMLGCPDDAAEELSGASPEAAGDPRYLDLAWQVAAARADWAGALEVAETALVVTGGGTVAAWIQRSYALRRLPGRGIPAAAAALRPALERFPGEPIVPYNLACYEARSGDLEAAWMLLSEAVRRGGSAVLVPMALADPDLAELRARVVAAWPDGSPV